MKYITLVAMVVIAMPAFAQTVYFDASKNIFETFDPLCDGSDPSVIFCDGFEDGTYINAAKRDDHAYNDYWVPGVFWNAGVSSSPFDPFRADPKGTDYAECEPRRESRRLV